jgi:hypothetical protein
LLPCSEDGDGIGDACEMGDIDNDGITDFKDNCRYATNPDQKIQIMIAQGMHVKILFYSDTKRDARHDER